MLGSDIANHANINDCLFGGREQLEEVDSDFLFCVSTGDPSGRDGGFWIRAERVADPTDWMVLNANNQRAGNW